MTSHHENMPFELRCRLSSLRVHTINEISLINLDRGKQLLYAENRDAVNAKFDREIELALSWEQFLRRQIANQFGSMPQAASERPFGECLPRCRKRWAQQLSNIIGTNEDRFLKFLVEFFVEMMTACSVGSVLDMLKMKERFFEEWHHLRSMRPIEDQTKTKRGGDAVARALAQKLASQRTRG